ncbi:MAG: efflux transporter outer membrane subunit [Akkermansiaceae bacterium]|nr:efflux transporter outer membrane subunit [Akkermansiaceae bacterium]
MSPRSLATVLPLSSVLLIAACKPLGPNHETPEMKLPASFSNGGVKWKKQSPDSLPNPRAWWRLYGDGTLNSLVDRALGNNQELAGASARVRQARSLSAAARGRYFPSIDLNPSSSRSKTRAQGISTVQNNFSVPADLSYELDVWGAVRRQVESADASADAQQESFNALKLTIASEVAQTYWALRAVDADRALLSRAVELRRKAFSLLKEQRDAGAISGLDLSRAEVEVATAEADKIQLDQDRVELVNALAVLAGASATGSSVPERFDLPSPPSIPVSVPSEVLRQRPDVRAAERRVAAANADIGVAMAAYYPSFTIGGSGGFSSNTASQLFKSSSLIWSIGPNINIPITQQKFLRDRKDAAVAAHEAASADYRQIVLESIREVENALQASSIIVGRQKAQDQAAAAAKNTFDLSSKRFDAGLVSFLDVVDAERTRLDAERRSNSVRAERLALSVSLAKAIGGGW